jgi:hypothetical protein
MEGREKQRHAQERVLVVVNLVDCLLVECNEGSSPGYRKRDPQPSVRSLYTVPTSGNYHDHVVPPQYIK